MQNSASSFPKLTADKGKSAINKVMFRRIGESPPIVNGLPSLAGQLLANEYRRYSLDSIKILKCYSLFHILDVMQFVINC